MHAAGIKRVFWTTAKGEWEGGKVHDLIDEMDRPPLEDDVPSVYVTKAEVCMIKGWNRY